MTDYVEILYTKFMDELREILGKILREARGHLTLFEASLKTKISDRRISAIEKGRANITIKTLEYILKKYDCWIEIKLKKEK